MQDPRWSLFHQGSPQKTLPTAFSGARDFSSKTYSQTTVPSVRRPSCYLSRLVKAPNDPIMACGGGMRLTEFQELSQKASFSPIFSSHSLWYFFMSFLQLTNLGICETGSHIVPIKYSFPSKNSLWNFFNLGSLDASPNGYNEFPVTWTKDWNQNSNPGLGTPNLSSFLQDYSYSRHTSAIDGTTALLVTSTNLPAQPLQRWANVWGILDTKAKIRLTF